MNNPYDMTGDPNNQTSRSSTLFTDFYPPASGLWNALPQRVPQNPSVTGFVMHSPLSNYQPNFRFGTGPPIYSQTVQFPFVQELRDRSETPHCSFSCKRKTDSPPPPPVKQFISEEKMSEHLSRLHISSETPQSEMESDHLRERRLFMCEEMKRFQAQTEPIIPDHLLPRFNRPCTALVLWKPPESIVSPLIRVEDREDIENENNNSNSATDNNVPMNDMEFEEL